jgi:hypothetical protein
MSHHHHNHYDQAQAFKQPFLENDQEVPCASP